MRLLSEPLPLVLDELCQQRGKGLGMEVSVDSPFTIPYSQASGARP